MNILIPTHGRPRLLARTLESLSQAELPKSLKKIYVIENGSDDGAREVVQKYLENLPLVYEHCERPGKNRALEIAIRKIKEGFLLFLDDDVRVCKDLLMRYEKKACQFGPGHFFGGPLLVDYEEKPPQWVLNWLPNTAMGWEPLDINDPILMEKSGKPPLGHSNWFLGPNCAAFAEDVLAVGGLPEHFGPGSFYEGTANNPTGSEDKMQQRLHAAGANPVYVPDAKVWHYVPKSCFETRWILHRTFRNNVGHTLSWCLKTRPGFLMLLRKNLKVVFKLFMEAPKYLSSFFTEDDEKKFLLRFRIYKLYGRLKAYRLYSKMEL